MSLNKLKGEAPNRKCETQRVNTFGEQLPVKKRLKLKNSKWPP